MKYAVSLVLFVSLTTNVFAHFHPDSLTKAQTQYIIDSILHSDYRIVKNEFSYENDTLLLSRKVYVFDFGNPVNGPLYYTKYYHRNGKLQSEGLEDGSKIGTWLYYDITGRFYKEYDFTTHTRKLYGIDKEPFDWAFDSIIHNTQRWLIRHYGESFYKTHVRFDSCVNWSPLRYSPYGDKLPDQPVENPREYSVSTWIVYNDSVTGGFFSLYFDSTLKLTWASFFGDTALYYPKINIDYAGALKIARAHGFDYVSLSDWDDKNKTFYWESSATLSTAGDDWHGSSKYKYIRINATTGKYTSGTSESYYDVDGFISDFQKDWKDTLKTPPGWKQLCLKGVTLDVPLDWMLIENYHHKTYEDSYWLTNGKDTLCFEERCGYFVELLSPDPPPEDGREEKRFLSQFKDGTVQGRTIDFHIVVKGLDNFSVNYALTEKGVAFNCGPIVYKFEAANLTRPGTDEILAILQTIRFSTY